MKHTQKAFVVPLIIVVMAILAIGGGIYYSKRSLTVPTGGENNQTNPASNSNRETYTSNNGNFQVRYPSTWTVKFSEYPWTSTIDSKIKGINGAVELVRDNYKVSVSFSPAASFSSSSSVLGSEDSTFTLQNSKPINTEDFVIYNNEILPDTFLARPKKRIDIAGEGGQPFLRVFQMVKSSGVYKIPQETPSRVSNATLYKDKNFYFIYIMIPKEFINKAETGGNMQNAINFVDQKILEEADQIISSFKFTK